MPNTPPPRGFLHRALGFGVSLFTVTVGVLTYLGIAPLLKPPESMAWLAYVFAGIAAAMVAFAIGVVKPRVPVRDLAQPVEEYWATTAIATQITLVWFLLEGALILCGVGFLLTGAGITVVVLCVAFAFFWSVGPAAFGGN